MPIFKNAEMPKPLGLGESELIEKPRGKQRTPVEKTTSGLLPP